MSDNPTSPLLGSTERPTSKHSNNSRHSYEDTPLLSRSDDAPRYDASIDNDGEDELASLAASSLRSLQNENGSSKQGKDGRRWPTIAAVSVLGLVAIAIIIGAFFAPAVVEEYTKEALVIEPTSLSIDSFTKTGVKARIQANFKMDASRVKNNNVRNIGRFGTWIAREIESKASAVEVYLPEYGNVLVGTAAVPPIKVDIRNGHITGLDFLSTLQPGNIEAIRQVANDWLDGRLDKVRVMGKANVGLKTGFISLGIQSISKSLVFEGDNLPAIPKYNITKLNFKEVPVPSIGRRGMEADASISLVNRFPVKFTIPPLNFDILVQSCAAADPYIQLANATTERIDVEPKSVVKVDVSGVVDQLSQPLVQNCTGSNSSPLDLLLGKYVKGRDSTVYVRGSSTSNDNTPDWITKIISSITVPVPFPGHTFDNVIKNFSLTDTHFSLPDPDAEPGSDDAKPQVSGKIIVIAGLPKEMNFGINVTAVKSTASVKYHGKKLGDLNLQTWQGADSERLDPEDGEGASIKINSEIKNVPLTVTNDEVFARVLQSLIFGGSSLVLEIEALVDVKVATVLGELVVKKMPANGVVPVKPISTGGGFSKLEPQVGDLRILSTSQTSMQFEAHVNYTNPTEYTAFVPFVNIHVLNNGSVLGDATAQNVTVVKGNNTGIIVRASWDPTKLGGPKAQEIGRELLSQYISGYNTTLTFKTHEDSIPFQPSLGKTLSRFEVKIPTPRIHAPGDTPDKDQKPHFIDNAVFHLFSSTAEFGLISPLQYSTIFIENINATAFYNHTEPIGHIDYDLPFKVPPGRSTSPRLPVDWSFDSVGYDKIREALGGDLKLDARGTVKVKLEHWVETIWYAGSGIGASVRI
ncbi:hypothetical protein BJ875DRAFT_538571 [Amylocarpus encephaloides]|uniref:Pre-rRNA processing protein n=1 Tax=Amylocarpus encephaloides TaxID=45428 RepID=A0A9P8CA70_9HELO|nr:hypothetical protein BJ875DRAFT_538571 [Amylocarpus encephaloides]